MTSVNTNIAAMTALRTLQATNSAMESVQNRVATGLKIGEAKDNAAYWSISTSLKSDNKSLSTVKDALNLGAATIDTAYEGLNAAKDVLDEIKSKLTAASQDGVDRSKIQAEIAELKKQLKSIAESSTFSGENWLSVNSSLASFNGTKSVVSSFNRDANGGVSIGTVNVEIADVKLFDASPTASGLLDKRVALKKTDGTAMNIGGFNAAADPNTTALDFIGLTGTGAAGQSARGAKVDLGILNLAGVTAGDKLKFDITVDGASGTVELATDGLSELNFKDKLQTALNAAIGVNGSSPTDKALVTVDPTTKMVSITATTSGTASSISFGGVTRTDGDGTITTTAGILNGSSIPAPDFGAAVKASATLGGTFAQPAATSVATHALLTSASDYSMTTTAARQVLTGLTPPDLTGAAPAARTLTFNVVHNGTPQAVTVEFTAGPQDASTMQTAIQAGIDTAFGWTASNRQITATASGGTGTVTLTTVGVGASQSVAVNTIAGTATGGLTVGTATAGTGGINAGDRIAFDVTYGTSTRTVDFTVTTSDMTGSPGRPAWATANQPTAAELKALLQAKIDATFLTAGSGGGPLTFNGATGGTEYQAGDIVLANDLTSISTKNAVGTDDKIQMTNLSLTRGGSTTAGLAGMAATHTADAGSGFRIQGGDSFSFKVQYGSTVRTITHNFTAADFTTSGGVVGIAASWASPGRPTADEWRAFLQTKIDTDFRIGGNLGAPLKFNGVAGGKDYEDGDIKVTETAGAFGIETKGTGPAMSIGLFDMVGTIAGEGTSTTPANVQARRFGFTSDRTTAVGSGGAVGFGTSEAAKIVIGAFNNTDLDGADRISFRVNVNGTEQDIEVTTEGMTGRTDPTDTTNLAADRARFQTKVQTALDRLFTGPNKVVFNAFDTSAGNAMTLTTFEKGADKYVAISNVYAMDGDGGATTSLGGLSATPVSATPGTPASGASIASITSGSGFTGPQTLGTDDSISFNLTTDGATKAITINRSVVNAALTRSDGTIANVAEYATVLNKALDNAYAPATRAVTASVDMATNTLKLTKDSAGGVGSLSITDVRSTAGADTMSVFDIDISDAALATAGVTAGDRLEVLQAYVALVNDTINKVTTAASNLGSASKRIELQQGFVNTLIDTIDKGVGALVDADITEESTRLQALQVKQQLGVQSLSMANQGAQQILRLFQ